MAGTSSWVSCLPREAAWLTAGRQQPCKDVQPLAQHAPSQRGRPSCMCGGIHCILFSEQCYAPPGPQCSFSATAMRLVDKPWLRAVWPKSSWGAHCNVHLLAAGGCWEHAHIAHLCLSALCKIAWHSNTSCYKLLQFRQNKLERLDMVCVTVGTVPSWLMAMVRFGCTRRLVLVADMGSGFARASARHSADLCPQPVNQKGSFEAEEAE